MPTFKASELISGMKLGQDIVSSNGVKLIPINTVLNDKIISYLKYWKFEKVLIKEEAKEIQNERKREYEEFKENYNISLDSVRSLFDGINKGDNISAKEVEELGSTLLEYCESFTYLKLINQLKNKDVYTYQHGMNVGIYSAILGRWLGASEKNQERLMVAGLFHDIGKSAVFRRDNQETGSSNRK